MDDVLFGLLEQERNRQGIEELADMLEVMEALASVENKTLEDVLSVKAKKQEKRGAFKDKIYLEGVE